MIVKNRLKKLLESLGIKMMVPTPDLLEKKLGGMTLNRFNQILNNDSKTELSVLELGYLKRWLAGVTGQSEASILLVEEAVAA